MKKKLATRYLNQEVVISDRGSDQPWAGIIRGLFKEGEKTFYRVDLINGEGHVDVSLSSVNWVKPLSAIKLTEVDSINFAPLRIFSGLN